MKYYANVLLYLIWVQLAALNGGFDVFDAIIGVVLLIGLFGSRRESNE